MTFDWLTAVRRRWSGRRRSIANRNRARRQARLALESLEPRLTLSAVTSFSDDGVGFSVTGEDQFQNGAVYSKNFNYTLLDKSFGATVGGYSNIGGFGKTGVQGDLSGTVDLGFNGGITIGGGTAHVNYLTNFNVSAAGVGGSDVNNLAFGDHFLINTSDTPASMTTSSSAAGSPWQTRIRRCAISCTSGRRETISRRGSGTGSAGDDWFFFHQANDKATDLADEVFANDPDWILPAP